MLVYSLIIKTIIRYYGVVTLIGESSMYFVLFASGICRYRLVIFLAISAIVRAIADVIGAGKNVLTILITVSACILLYLDILYGQIYPIFPQINILISVGALVLSIFFFNVFIEKVVQAVTNNKVFIYCLHCKFEHTHLVDKCLNCGLTMDNNMYQNNVSRKPESLLDIADGEYIVEQYRFGCFSGVYKNGTKLAVKKIIITNIRVIFINYNFYSRGWTSREIILLNDITKISLDNKKHRKVTAPILTLYTTNDDNFELFYYAADSSSVYLLEIADCLVSQNDSIENKYS